MNDVTEQDLHAYVDGQLDAARRQEVEAHLAADPVAADKVAAYRRQNETLHALFDPTLDEAIPARLRKPAPTRILRSMAALRYAAVVAWLAIGVAAGYALRGPAVLTSAPIALAQQAVAAHVVYAPEVAHPVEVDAKQEAHLVKWLSKRLDGDVRPPHLAELGYELVGGRLLPAGEGPAAQFMYQDARGQRLTLYVRRDAKDGETAFRYAKQGSVSVFYWVDGPFGYALSGEQSKNDLLQIAHSVYQQLNS
jgi:anti-sigma factor RsiW